MHHSFFSICPKDKGIPEEYDQAQNKDTGVYERSNGGREIYSGFSFGKKPCKVPCGGAFHKTKKKSYYRSLAKEDKAPCVISGNDGKADRQTEYRT